MRAFVRILPPFRRGRGITVQEINNEINFEKIALQKKKEDLSVCRYACGAYTRKTAETLTENHLSVIPYVL